MTLVKVSNSLEITNKILKESLTRKKDDFKSVIIGEQEWMVENLNVDCFRNGVPIPEVKTDEEWEKAGKENKPAWCYYDNDPKNEKKYGKLYNWFAVNDPRGLAHNGWHLPSQIEWIRLEVYLGVEMVAGTKMKSSSGWDDYKGASGNGTNESGFAGSPGGIRFYWGEFCGIGRLGNFWSSSEIGDDNAWYRNLRHWDGVLDCSAYDKGYGSSVRCLRDK